MSLSAQRRKRCSRAIDGVLETIQKKSCAPSLQPLLHERYLGPMGILEVGRYELLQSGLGAEEAELLSIIPSLTRYCLRTEYGPHPRLNSFKAAAAFLSSLYRGVSVEQFHLLCLDSSGKMIKYLLLQEGTVDQTPFYLGKVLQAVIVTGAQSIVLCHNHPGGTLRPSLDDIRCTVNALNALCPLHVPLLDHIIIAGAEAVSIRQSDFIDASAWLSQLPSTRLLQNWLD